MSLNEPPAIDAARLRRLLEADDERLLVECDVDLHRVRGPGGQHRNKVASAVRLRLKTGGITVTATERRSQHENRAQAVQRLREAIALTARLPLPERVDWPDGVDVRQGRLRVADRNPALYRVIALVLDAMAACACRPSDAARRLGVTSSSLTKFLVDHPKAWAELNRMRSSAGLAPLKA